MSDQQPSPPGRLLLWLPLLVGLSASFYLSSRPGRDVPHLMPDAVAHVVEYAVLGLLVLRAFNRGMSRRPSLRVLLLSILFCMGWGVSDEYHQALVPGREASLEDLVSDFVGVLLACGLFYMFRWIRPHRPART